MSSLDRIFDLLEAHPIIAAVRDEKNLEAALQSSVAVIFLLDASLANLKARVRQIREIQKLVFVHLEMVAGLSKDQAALEFLQTEIGPDGIITTKPNLIQTAKHLGLLTVQRLFILDSLSIQTGLKMLQGNHPDLMEIMPGIIPKVIPEIKRHSQAPIIAGGMVSTKEEIIELLKVGAIAISTSREQLWQL
ncbi:MAG TPA: glycerol-3-phosphate responsive antiterminator [Bacillota bacterium]